MTVATIYYHDSTGADTNSGSNAPTTAHTDVTLGETISGTGTTTTFTFSGTINLTGVNDDGTDLLVVASTAGERHLFRITAFAGSVAACTGLTVAEAIGSTTITNLAWGIGGMRQTLQDDATRFDFEDVMGGWEMIFNDGGSFDLDANNTVTWGGGGTKATGPNIMRTAAGFSTRAVIVQTGVSVSNMMRTNGFSTDQYLEVHDLTFRSQLANGGEVWWLGTLGVSHLFRNCAFEQTGTLTGNGVTLAAHDSFTTIEDCQFTNVGSSGCTGANIESGSTAQAVVRRCRFTDLGDRGIRILLAQRSRVLIQECIFDGCTDGIEITRTANDLAVDIFDCIFYNQSAHGIDFGVATMPAFAINRIQRCIFFDNGGYGISVTDAAGAAQVLCRNNAFYSNTSGETVNTTNVDHITLTADPFTDAAGADFSLNDTAGGGAAVDDEALEIAN